ncbi:hypothetical protein NIES2135_21280 [Leptolyngbya boryana NIES-2135]|uniref:Uncharacterized protein n=2 Tax=Leptolyngbya group TaxID=3081713 RepID=A0A1Z4JEU3_LEPBY|nr:hypothetical protein LBWT_A0360 [Leptolyngbya boryana IAM M-101]BAS66214.1 hypothetical protein LBDG_A0360 [Leptolyngbya boryana dg5]BAY55305.1 hypothetical protein NIES2135_21280 [Leptolyngbya boryana NIES-2135]
MMTIDPSDPTTVFLFCPNLEPINYAIAHPDDALKQAQESYPKVERIIVRYREFSCPITAKCMDLV